MTVSHVRYLPKVNKKCSLKKLINLRKLVRIRKQTFFLSLIRIYCRSALLINGNLLRNWVIFCDVFIINFIKINLKFGDTERERGKEEKRENKEVGLDMF